MRRTTYHAPTCTMFHTNTFDDPPHYAALYDFSHNPLLRASLIRNFIRYFAQDRDELTIYAALYDISHKPSTANPKLRRFVRFLT